jgi:hypothetical protein
MTQSIPPVEESTVEHAEGESPFGDRTAEEWHMLDRIFDVLSNHRRRRVLQYLERNEQALVGELAEHIAAIENKKAITALSSQERKRVYIALYQSHLPKMASADVVQYDKDRGTVELAAAAAELCSLLAIYESIEEPSIARRPWSRYYLVYTGVTITGLTIALVLAPAAASLLSGLFLFGYGSLAVAHALAEYDATGRSPQITEGITK